MQVGKEIILQDDPFAQRIRRNLRRRMAVRPREISSVLRGVS